MPPELQLDNPFAGFLEESPSGFRANLFARPEVTGSLARQQFYQTQVDDLFNLFQGRLGEQIRAGGAPNLTGEQFLNQTDLNRRFMAQTPTQRGLGTAQFAPVARTSFF